MTDGFTPLHLAVETDAIDIAKLLLAHKAKADIQSNDGRTPLSVAESDEMSNLLRKYGAK